MGSNPTVDNIFSFLNFSERRIFCRAAINHLIIYMNDIDRCFYIPYYIGLILFNNYESTYDVIHTHTHLKVVIVVHRVMYSYMELTQREERQSDTYMICVTTNIIYLQGGELIYMYYIWCSK